MNRVVSFCINKSLFSCVIRSNLVPFSLPKLPSQSISTYNPVSRFQSNRFLTDSTLNTNSSPPLTHSTLTDSVLDTDSDIEDIDIPDPPTTCCMSGCANCVWIDYAKELAAIYKDGGRAAEKVMRAIEDPSIKIFISLELKEALKNSD